MHRITPRLRESWPLYTVLTVLLLLTTIIEFDLLQHTHGVFSLPNDQDYLQLSTAKTLAFKHVWGISKYDFTAASPSLLYPLLIAPFFFVFGSHLIIGMLINLLASAVFLILVHRWLRSNNIRSVTRLFILLLFVPSLPLMVLYGMERPLLLSFSFLFFRQLLVDRTKPQYSRWTFIYGALLTATSYVGIILIIIACLSMMISKKWRETLKTAIWCLSPVIVFGIVSMSKGSYLIPNPLMITSINLPFYLDCFSGCAICLIPRIIRHLPISKFSSNFWAQGIVTLSIMLILLSGSIDIFRREREACLELCQKEYLIGKFIRRYFFDRPIAADNVGVISFLTEGRYFDLSGLATNKIARNKDSLSPELILHLTRDFYIQVAIINDRHSRIMPPEWVKAASWTIASHTYEKNNICFYARDSALAFTVKRYLEEFDPFLPKEIIVKY